VTRGVVVENDDEQFLCFKNPGFVLGRTSQKPRAPDQAPTLGEQGESDGGSSQDGGQDQSA
jgi:hypothetical protein